MTENQVCCCILGKSFPLVKNECFSPLTTSCSAGSCCLCVWLCSFLNNISFGT